MNRLTPVLRLLKDTVTGWKADRAPKMGAALAFYTALAFAPILLIAIAIAGLLLEQETAREAIVAQITALVGPNSAGMVEEALSKAWRPGNSALATAAGVVTFFIAVSGVFGELQDSLDIIWKVQKKPGRGLLGTLKDRFLSFSMVLGVGFLLLVSLVVSASLQVFAHRITTWGGTGFLIQALNFLVAFGVTAALFAMIFRFLPDARTRWRDVWVGAATTALLFSAGRFAIGLYLGMSTIGSTYGAAGSFVVLILWIYYSSLILFLGAELTKHYADQFGATPVPHGDAIRAENPLTPEGAHSGKSGRPGTASDGAPLPPRVA